MWLQFLKNCYLCVVCFDKMGKEKKKNKFLKWLVRRYQLVVYRDVNYEEVKRLRLNRVGVLLSIFAIFVIFFATFSALVVYTPIKHLIPGYPDSQTIKMIYENAIKVDSLSQELEIRDRYLEMVHEIIFKEVPVDEEYEVSVPCELSQEQIAQFNDPTQPRKKSDDVEIEKNVVDKNALMPSLFTPMTATVVNSYNRAKGHNGVDLASTGDGMVSSVLGGIVVLSTYTIDDGYTIIVQHKSNILSVYKHCQTSLVKQGQRVHKGETIATYGDTGENSNGPHLHFELWRNGESLNPTDYIIF